MHSSDTSISARDYFRVKIDETPNKATARSLSQAFTAFTAWYPAGSLGFTSFSEDNLRQWTAWLLSEGYTLKTAAYYLKNLSALYGRAVADGIAAPATAFADVRTRLSPAYALIDPATLTADEASSIRGTVAQALTDNPPQWHAMQFRPRVTLDDIRNRLSALHCAGLLGDIYYPCEEIASRIGRRLVRRRQPVVPGLLFFRTRTTDIAPLMRRIGDLAWCYRAGTGPDSPYAVIPDVQMHIYQVTIGIIRPDTRICPAGTIQLRPGDRVEIIGGPFAGLHANIQSIHTPAESATICRLLLPGTNGIEWRIDTPTLLLHKA